MQPLVVLSQSPGAALSRSQGPLLKLFLSAPQLLAVPGPSCLLSLLLHITHCSSLDISVKQYYNPKGNTLLSLPAPPKPPALLPSPTLGQPPASYYYNYNKDFSGTCRYELESTQHRPSICFSYEMLLNMGKLKFTESSVSQ